MAGMHVPVSYFKSSNPKRLDSTEAEIRFTIFENKEGLSIEEFKEKIVLLLTNNRLKKVMSKYPESKPLPFSKQSVIKRFKEKNN